MQFILYYFDPKITSLFHDEEDEQHHIHHKIHTAKNFIQTNGLLARIIEAEDEQTLKTLLAKDPAILSFKKYSGFPMDSSVQFDEKEKGFIAKRPGYVIFDRKSKQYRVSSPLYIPSGNMEAFFLIYTGRQDLIPSIKNIITELNDAGITRTRSPRDLQADLNNIRSGPDKIIPLLAAKGIEPKDGHAEYFELILKEAPDVGKVSSQGNIDYKARTSFIQVEKDQPVMIRHLEKKNIDGQDIYGNILSSKMTNPGKLIPGEGFYYSNKEVNTLLSKIEGALVIKNSQVTVESIFTTEKDVDYSTGHIEFSGNVHVRGAVLSGFKVKATGDVIVDSDIEDGVVEAGGSVLVKMGITGSGKSVIKAGQDIQASFVMNSHLEARGDITIEDSIVNSQVLSNHNVTVMARRGHIIGGVTAAQDDINIKISGNKQGAETILEGGRKLLLQQELEQYESEYQEENEHYAVLKNKLLSEFGDEISHPEELKELREDKRSLYLEMIRGLKDTAAKRDFIYKKIQEVKQHNEQKHRPRIFVHDKAWPGTLVRIDDYQLKLDTVTEFARFYIDENEKRINSSPIK